MEISIIVPTFNEGQNVRLLTRRLAAVLTPLHRSFEILFMDDSTDDTVAELRSLAQQFSFVKPMFRQGGVRGLSAAVIDGIKAAEGEFIVVMDADLQHPPEVIPEMLSKLDEGYQMVIPSRFISNGSDGGLTIGRKLVSLAARMMARIALKRVRRISDPTSGFFAVRKAAIAGKAFYPLGWKVMLELIVRADLTDIAEIPFHFQPRDQGQSKMSMKEQRSYMLHLLRLVLSSAEDRRFYLFSVVGLSGVAVNLIVYRLLLAYFSVPEAYISSSALAMLSNFLLNESLTWRMRARGGWFVHLFKYCLIALSSILGSGLLVAWLHAQLHLSALASGLIGIIAGIFWNFILNDRWTFAKKAEDSRKNIGPFSKNKKILALILCIAVFVSEFSFGFWMAHVNHFVPNDAISRIANAYYVLNSRFPSLSAIGFVWNPLPSLLIIPLLGFQDLFPQLAYDGLAAILLTAAAAAGIVYFLARAFFSLGHPTASSLAFPVLFITNPFMFLYGSNGMSEMIFMFFIVLSVLALTKSFLDQQLSSYMTVGFSLALAFLTRYETVAFGFCLALALVVFIFSNQRRGNQTQRETYQKIEAVQFIVLMPVIYTVVVWILLNYVIMGNPFYFLNSSYSNLAQSKDLANSATVGRLIGHLSGSAEFAVSQSLYFLIPLIAVVIIRLFRRTLFQVDLLILFLLVLSIPMMQIVMLDKGASFGWLRFFVYPLSIIAAWLPYECRGKNVSRKAGYWLSTGFIALSMIVGDALTFSVMHNPRLAPDEFQTFHYRESEAVSNYNLSMVIAQDLNERLRKQHALVLMDSYSANRIILAVKYPKDLVITSDRDFKFKLSDPANTGVNYLLVPSGAKQAKYKLDAINQRYKTLYDKGAPFARLVKTYGGSWKLYQVVEPSAAKHE
ncbi:MAG: glycosyltransferase [Sporolactobacillus sp.]